MFLQVDLLHQWVAFISLQPVHWFTVYAQFHQWHLHFYFSNNFFLYSLISIRFFKNITTVQIFNTLIGNAAICLFGFVINCIILLFPTTEEYMLVGSSYPKISEKGFVRWLQRPILDLQTLEQMGQGKVAVVRYLGSQFLHSFMFLLGSYHFALLKLPGSLHCGGPPAGSVCCHVSQSWGLMSACSNCHFIWFL